MYKKFILIKVIFVFLSIVFSMQLVSGQTKAKYAGEFLSLGVGARSLGMGGVHAAFANDVTSVYWNPAGLARLNYPEIALMHAEQFAGVVQYNFGAFAIPYGQEASLGIGLIRLAVDDIPHTTLLREDLELGEPFVDENGVTRINEAFPEYFFSNAEYAFFLSYARAKSHFFSYGGSVKIVHKGFDDTSAWGIGFDIGAQMRIGNRLLIGANLQDATTTILAWNTGRKELIIPTLKIGAAFPLSMNFLKGTILPALDADIRFEGREQAAQISGGAASMDFHAGFEYFYKDVLALRVGSDTGHFSAGAGICLPKLEVDYAFMSHSDLKNTHRVSLKVSIRENKFRRE